MKYKPEDYSIVDSGFYGLANEVDNYKEKLVECRKPHKCSNCQNQV